jgi:hypothetical protein
MMKYKDVDPRIKRLFPWSLFLLVATLFLLASCEMARAHPDQPTCDEVVKRVGMKPLWLAERQARKRYPDITEAQIAWGRACVEDHRRAMLKGIADKIKGVF